MSEETWSKVSRWVRQYGASRVARVLGIPRNTLLSYVAGTARDGTEMLIETRVPVGADLAPSATAARVRVKATPSLVPPSVPPTAA